MYDANRRGEMQSNFNVCSRSLMLMFIDDVSGHKPSLLPAILLAYNALLHFQHITTTKNAMDLTCDQQKGGGGAGSYGRAAVISLAI